MKVKRALTVIIERDEDGYFVGTVPELLFEKKGLIPVSQELLVSRRQITLAK